MHILAAANRYINSVPEFYLHIDGQSETSSRYACLQHYKLPAILDFFFGKLDNVIF